MCTPAIDRADPRNSSGAVAPASANAITGRANRSFNSPGDDADDTLMPAFAIHAQTKLRLAREIDRDHGQFCFLSHLLLNRLARFVEFLERRRERSRLDEVVSKQATDADAHVVETTRGVQPRCRARTRDLPPTTSPSARPAASHSARIPGRALPALIRRKPCCTRMRLL